MKNSNLNKTVLLVEDEAILAMHEKQQLEDLGYEIHHVLKGEDAVEFIIESELAIDIILMDIDLGVGIDGTQAAELILKEKDIPIIFLSSHSELEVVEKTEKISSYGYVVKNSGIIVLDTTIKMAFRLFDANAQVKRELEEHKQTRNDYSMLFNQMTDGFALHEIICNDAGTPVDYRFLKINPAFERYTGLIAKNVIGRTVLEVLPETKKYWIDTYGKVALTGESISFQNYSAPLKKYYSVKSFQPAPNQFACIFSDITDILKTKEELQKSEERLSLIIRGSTDAPWDWDYVEKKIYYSPQWWKQIGYEPDELPSTDHLWYELLHHEDSDAVAAVLEKAIKTDLESYQIEFRLRHKDGHYVPVLSRGFITRNENGEIMRLTGTNTDLTKRKNAEQALKESEALLNEMGNIAKIGGWEMDLIDRTAVWTKGTYDIIEIDYDAPVPGPDEHQEYYDSEFREMISHKMNDLIENGIELDFEAKLTTAKGNRIWVRAHGRRKMENGVCVKIYGILQDITEKKLAETELEKIEWLLNPKENKTELNVQEYGDLTELNQNRTIMDSVGKEILNGIVSDYLSLLKTSAAVYEKNGDYAFGIFSSDWCKFMDCSSRALCKSKDNRKALESGKWLCHESCWSDASKKSIQTNEAVDVECNGGIHIYALPIKANNEIIGAINFGYGSPPTDDGKLTEIASRYKVSFEQLKKIAQSYESRPAFIIDIAKEKLANSAQLIKEIVERKIAENELKTSLEEKEILLRELNHRTKNNLQIISSMLSLKAVSIGDKQLTDIFKDIQNKILSMALVHKKLYESGDLSRINLKEYLEDLTQDLKSSLCQPTQDLTISIKAVNVHIPLDTAIPIGIIINELVTNAIKHAFPDNRKGCIDIELDQDSNQKIFINISDNGIGIPENFEIKKDGGFGLQTVGKLVETQLGGTMTIKSHNGLHCNIITKNKPVE